MGHCEGLITELLLQFQQMFASRLITLNIETPNTRGNFPAYGALIAAMFYSFARVSAVLNSKLMITIIMVPIVFPFLPDGLTRGELG
jgi:hypothetical protein